MAAESHRIHCGQRRARLSRTIEVLVLDRCQDGRLVCREGSGTCLMPEGILARRCWVVGRQGRCRNVKDPVQVPGCRSRSQCRRESGGWQTTPSKVLEV